ncbi:MAG: hypothetical protein WCY43_02400 [Patescibacteria group bacterium]|nr:hypothetical protein [Patescibacteria group bacterium]
MIKLIKEYQELEHGTRIKILKEIGKNENLVNTLLRDFNVSNREVLKMRTDLISGESNRKSNLFYIFLDLYPYLISLFAFFILSVVLSVSFIVTTQNFKIGLLIVVVSIVPGLVYVKIKTNKLKRELNEIKNGNLKK